MKEIYANSFRSLSVLLFCLLILTYSAKIDAVSSLDVVINEIAWMGTGASSWDEWIELYNTTSNPIDLTGWKIEFISSSRDPIDLSSLGNIESYEYLLLERAEKAIDITADLEYGGSRMSNSGEYLQLKDSTGDVIDKVDCSTSWFAGTASPDYRSMERIDPTASSSDPNNWATNDGITRNGQDADGNPINGTPKARNSATNSPPTANAGPDQSVNVGDTVQLDGSGSTDPDGDTLSYNWSFTSKPAGSGATLSDSASNKPTFVADIAGDYILELTVDDGWGGSDSDQVIINAISNQPPTCSNINTSTNEDTSVDIDLASYCSDPNGDSLTGSFVSDPAHGTAQFLSPTIRYTPEANFSGSDSFTYKVTDGEFESNTATVNVTVNEANDDPVADAGSDQSVALGSEVQLDGSSSSDPDGDDLSFSWSFTTKPGQSDADFDDSTRVDPIFVPDRNGTYRVKLIVNDGRGGEDTDELRVTTTPNPKVKAGTLDFNYFTGNNPPNFNAQAKADVEVDVGNAGAGTRGAIIVFKYDEDPDNPFTAKPPLKYLDVKTVNVNAGTAHVKMYYQDSEIPQGVDESTLRLYYYQSGAGWILCANSGVNPNQNVIWGDIPVSDLTGTPLTASGNSPPTADANGPYSCSVGEDITLDGSGSSDSDGTITNYEWDYDNNGQYDDATGVNPSYSCSTSGSHTIGLKVTDNDGATDTDSATVNVNQPPTADANGPYSCNVGDTVNLDGSGSSDSDGSISNYEWDLDNDGQYDDATGVSPSYSCTTSGTHTIGLKVTDDDNATDTDSTTVNVNSPPTANFTYSPTSPTTQDTIQFTDQSGDTDGTIASWNWNFGDGNTSTTQNPIHQYANDGNYTVTLTVTDDDGATDTTTKQITIGEPLSSGDCDGDGEITMEDAQLAAEYALGLKTPTDAQKEAADVVAPVGVIDIRDAIAIAEVAQGLRSGF